MRTNPVKILADLTRKVIYCEFSRNQNRGPDIHSFESEYFGFDIKVIAIDTIRGPVVYLLFLENWMGVAKTITDTDLLNWNGKAVFPDLATVVNVLNDFIRRHSFLIIRHGHGTYRDLDPNGNEYMENMLPKQTRSKPPATIICGGSVINTRSALWKVFDRRN